MIHNEDFKIWLGDPCTKFFQKWLKRNLYELKKDANELSYNNFHKNQKDENATTIYGMCRGFEGVLCMFEDVKDQIQKENEAENLPENVEKPEINDVIGEMIELVYPKNVEENGSD